MDVIEGLEKGYLTVAHFTIDGYVTDRIADEAEEELLRLAKVGQQMQSLFENHEYPCPMQIFLEDIETEIVIDRWHCDRCPISFIACGGREKDGEK